MSALHGNLADRLRPHRPTGASGRQDPRRVRAVLAGLLALVVLAGLVVGVFSALLVGLTRLILGIET